MKNKRILLSALFVQLSMIPTLAKLGGDGYYRVQNVATSRWVSVISNYGKVDKATKTGEAPSIVTKKKVESDPSEVIYFKKNTDGTYNLYAQGTNVYDVIQYNVKIHYDEASDTYQAYQGKVGVKYITDASTEDGTEVTFEGGPKDSTTMWKIEPIDDTNYFGINATISANGKYYAPFYADFGFEPSSDMKVYVVDRMAYGQPVLKEISGTVPASTPVIIECQYRSTTNSKVKLVRDASTTVGNNLLSGTYFNFEYKDHDNYVANDSTKTRILSTDADGKLAFIAAGGHIAANTAYLVLPESETSAEDFSKDKSYPVMMDSDILLGDANVDGVVDSRDYMAVINYTLGNPVTKFSKINADVNKDGNINTVDAMGIINITLK